MISQTSSIIDAARRHYDGNVRFIVIATLYHFNHANEWLTGDEYYHLTMSHLTRVLSQLLQQNRILSQYLNK